jgi:hypothetical protein
MTTSETIINLNTAIAEAKRRGDDTKQISDTHHTFAELYRQRAYLFAALLRAYPCRSFRSKLHDDGTMFNGDFIAGIETAAGQYTFHFKLKYWRLFDGVQTLSHAPKYDGHMPGAVVRLMSLEWRPTDDD